MLYYTLRFLTAYLVYLYPAYSSFKSLSHRPVSDTELERWVKHWAVLGCFVAFEYLFEWVIFWLPFYYEIKTLFLLFCSLPQTQGAIYLYDFYLQPFFSRNETEIDAHIASARANILTFLQARLSGLFQAVTQGLSQAQTQAAQNAEARGKPPPQPVIGVPAQLAQNIWSTVGGIVAGSIARANSQPAPEPAPAAAPAPAPAAQ